MEKPGSMILMCFTKNNKTRSACHPNYSNAITRSFILDYRIPIDKIKFLKIQSASIGFVARNLAILYRDKRTKDAGLDPEMQQTVGNATGTAGAGEPRTRTMGVNLNVKF